MLPNYRHAPFVDPLRKRCPVCNHAVYSLAGIHPQCAVKLVDSPQFTSKKQAASKTEPPVDVAARGINYPRKTPNESERAGLGPRFPSDSRRILTPGPIPSDAVSTKYQGQDGEALKSGPLARRHGKVRTRPDSRSGGRA
jgi:hypothetical protein